jgi:hypothetical protein
MEHTGIQFNNVVEDDSLENGFLFRNFYNGNGVAIGDINNDPIPTQINSSSIKEILSLKIYQIRPVLLEMINGIRELFLPM